MKIYDQTTEISSEFNRKLFITSLNEQLSDKIFEELIKQEKDKIVINITMEIKD